MAKKATKKKTTLRAATKAAVPKKVEIPADSQPPEVAVEQPSKVKTKPHTYPMSAQRYLETAERIILHRNELATFIRGFFRGQETGYIHYHYENRPAPAYIQKIADVHVMEAIKHLNCALFALENHWLADYPETELPDKITYEFKI